MTTDIVLVKDWNSWNWHWFIKHTELMTNSIEDMSPYDTPFYQHIGEYYRDILGPFDELRKFSKGVRDMVYAPLAIDPIGFFFSMKFEQELLNLRAMKHMV